MKHRAREVLASDPPGGRLLRLAALASIAACSSEGAVPARELRGACAEPSLSDRMLIGSPRDAPMVVPGGLAWWENNGAKCFLADGEMVPARATAPLLRTEVSDTSSEVWGYSILLDDRVVVEHAGAVTEMAQVGEDILWGELPHCDCDGWIYAIPTSGGEPTLVEAATEDRPRLQSLRRTAVGLVAMYGLGNRGQLWMLPIQ